MNGLFYKFVNKWFSFLLSGQHNMRMALIGDFKLIINLQTFGGYTHDQ